MTSVSSASSSTADIFAGRQIPWSSEAEQAVLGAMMLDQDAALRAAEILDDAMFYKEAHRRLFRAMISLTERSDVIDPVTLRNELLTRGELDSAGGIEYIAMLIDVVPTAANVAYHAKIVRDKAIIRRLIETSTEVIQLAYDAKHHATELLDIAEHKVFQLSQTQHTEDFVRIKELLWPTMEHIEMVQRGELEVTGVPTGFKELDHIIAGLHRADLVVLAARPSMGKTALALNIAQHAAIECDVGTAIFSLEMSKESLVQRLLCSEGLVDVQKLRHGNLGEEDYTKLARAAGILGSAPMWIDDSAMLSPLEMRAKARRLKAENTNLGLVIVDYLQLMRGPSRSESRQQEISEISRSLKALAKELEVPVLALSQLSRAPEQRTGDHRPKLSDLRESGAIEQDADVVLFIYREEVYTGTISEDGSPLKDRDGDPVEGMAELIVGKHRNGPTGTAKLHFGREFTRFRDYTRRAAEPEEHIGF